MANIYAHCEKATCYLQNKIKTIIECESSTTIITILLFFIYFLLLLLLFFFFGGGGCFHLIISFRFKGCDPLFAIDDM